MGKTDAERQQKRRTVLKTNGIFDHYRAKETLYHKQWLVNKKAAMSDREKSIWKEDERKRKADYRARKRAAEVQKSSASGSQPSPPMRKSVLSRAVKRVQAKLPTSPRKRSKVVQKLALKFSPRMFLIPSKRRESRALSDSVISDVVKFYERDDISSQAPGKKDYVIMRDNGLKEKVQKRFLIMTVGETFEQFKLEHPSTTIGKSKFADLRPKHVCLESDTPPNICLCIYHENIRLILAAIPDPPSSTSEFVKNIVCNDEVEGCMFQKDCNKCGDLKILDNLLNTFDENMMETEIKYKQWIKSEDDKLMRQVLCDSIQNVLNLLKSKLPQFLKHVFIKRIQSHHFDKLKRKFASWHFFG